MSIDHDKLSKILGSDHKSQRTGTLTRPTTPEWDFQLKQLVKEVILMQRSGFDALASAAWDDVVRHWELMEDGKADRD